MSKNMLLWVVLSVCALPCMGMDRRQPSVAESTLDKITFYQTQVRRIQGQINGLRRDSGPTLNQAQAAMLARYEDELRIASEEVESLEKILVRAEQLAELSTSESTRIKLSADKSAAQIAEAETAAVAAREMTQQAQITANKDIQLSQNARAIEEGRQQIALGQERTKQLNKLVWGVPLGIIASLATYFLLKHLLVHRPTIIEKDDTSIGNTPPLPHFDRLILSPAREKQLMNVFNGISRAVKKKLPLSNMLFWGPPGTGKTMAAQAYVRKLSREGLIDHVIVRGSAFKRLDSAGKAQHALAHIIRWAKKGSKRPLAIVFDEAEAMFVDRDAPEANEMTRDLTTTMLSFFEKAADPKKFFIISTNYPQKIDRALRNRIDKNNWIHFEKPGAAELERLLHVYIALHILNNKIAVSPELDAALPAIAQRLAMQGLVGREVDSLLVQVLYRVLNGEAQELNPAIFDEVVSQIEQTHELHAY